MKTPERRDKIIAAISTVLFFVALFGMIMIHDSNKSLEDMLKGAKLKNETVLSEKLSLDKEIRDYKIQLAALKGKNKELDKYLSSANSNLAAKEKEIKVILRDNPKVRSLEKELAVIKGLRSDLENQLAMLSNQLKDLEDSNNELNSQVAALSSRNQELTAQNAVMKSFAANNYQIEASRGKQDRLTVVARRTKRLKVGFDLPQTVAENVQFKIKTPDGKLIEKDDEDLSASILAPEDGSDLMVSLVPMDNFEVTKRIEMKYEPKKRLGKGLYTIDIYNGDTYMVSCQVKLR